MHGLVTPTSDHRILGQSFDRRSMDIEVGPRDGWRETHYTDVDWTYPPLQCPHSCGASASRLMRLLAQRTHKTCGSKKPCISVVDRRVYPTLAPTSSSTSLSSATSSSMFTRLSLSSAPTTPPSSPSKSTQSNTPLQPHAVLLSRHSININNRCPAQIEPQHCRQLSYAKPPFYHASLLRSSLPRRKGNFRKSSRPAIDFFREEVTKPGGFAHIFVPAKDVLGSDAFNVAVHVAEAVLCSYETRSGFYGRHGLSLSKDLYDTKRGDIRTRRRSRSHRNSLDILIAEEDVDEGRDQWLETTRELVGPITLRPHSRLDIVSQTAAAGSIQSSCNQASQRLVQTSGQTRFVSFGQMKTKDLEIVKDPAPNWWYNPPSTSIQMAPGIQPVMFGSHVPQSCRSKLAYSQVVGSEDGSAYPSAAAARCAHPGEDGASPMLESSASSSRKPSTQLRATSGVFPSRFDPSFQLADVTSSNSRSTREVHQDGRLKNDTAASQMASSRKSEAALSVPQPPQVFRSTPLDVEPARSTSPCSVFGTLKPATSDGRTIQRRPQSAGGGIEREGRSRSADLDLSLRALVSSLPNGVGLRQDAQGFWEPVTPPCSPHVVREQQARSARSGSIYGSPLSGDSPGLNLGSTPTSTAVSSATSPPPDSPGSYYSPESQNLCDYIDLPNPTSLLPAFLASVAKRKRSSRTREIVDKLKLNNVAVDDDASDSGTVPDTPSGASKVPLRDGFEDALSLKSPSFPSGMAARSVSPGALAAMAPPVASSKSTSSLEVTASKASRDKGKPASNSRPVSAGPVSVNGWAGMSGVSMHGRSPSGARNNLPTYTVPSGLSVAPARASFPIPPAQLVPPPVPHAPLPPGIHPQPPPRSAPIVRVPAQQPGFYGPVYPVYPYPVAPPIAQPVPQGPWMLGYRPPQGTVHIPTQATITGVSGMRHVNW